MSFVMLVWEKGVDLATRQIVPGSDLVVAERRAIALLNAGASEVVVRLAAYDGSAGEQVWPARHLCGSALTDWSQWTASFNPPEGKRWKFHKKGERFHCGPDTNTFERDGWYRCSM